MMDDSLLGSKNKFLIDRNSRIIVKSKSLYILGLGVLIANPPGDFSSNHFYKPCCKYTNQYYCLRSSYLNCNYVTTYYGCFE